MMKITVKKLTDTDLMRRACEMTFRGKSKVAPKKMYLSEHSPIRTQVFWIEFHDIPTFASTHLVRHKLGVEHFVLSNREDRGGDREANRWTPVKHGMFINAQELIFMARMRLCKKAHPVVREIIAQLRYEIAQVDPALAECMVPNCEYRGGCHELKPCYEE